MKTCKLGLRLVSFGISFFILFHRAFAADTNLPPRLTFELRDGSRVVGESSEKYFKFYSTLFGKIKLAVKDIRSVECLSTNSAKLTAVNGDTLIVSFVNSELAVKTSFGKVELPVDSVRRLMVLAARGIPPRHPGLVALWSGEGNADDSIDDNNGVLKGGVSFGPGKFGQAFKFNGIDSYVEVPDSESLRLTNELTIEFWVKRRQLNWPYGYLLNKGGNWTRGQLNYGVDLPSHHNHSLIFLFAGGDRYAGSINDLKWHHCVIMARNGDVNPIFYIDGVRQIVFDRDGANTINLHPSHASLQIGAQVDSQSGYNFYCNALLDEIAIYNRFLTPTEIREDYEAGAQN